MSELRAHNTKIRRCPHGEYGVLYQGLPYTPIAVSSHLPSTSVLIATLTIDECFREPFTEHQSRPFAASKLDAPRYNPPNSCHSLRGIDSDPTRSNPPSAPAAWGRFIAPATHASIASSPSKSSRLISVPIPN